LNVQHGVGNRALGGRVDHIPRQFRHGELRQGRDRQRSIGDDRRSPLAAQMPDRALIHRCWGRLRPFVYVSVSMIGLLVLAR
jgi:hypothetical protein